MCNSTGAVAASLLIDAAHRRLTAPGEVLDRTIARYRIESVFQDDVAEGLERVGYRPRRSTHRIDTRDWYLDRDRVLQAIDDAIEAQRRRGIGRDIPPPRRPRSG